MEFEIYSSSDRLKLLVEPNDNSTQVEEIQSGNVLNVSFTLPDCVQLDVNDYADFMGRRYWLVEKYRPLQKSTLEWEYSLKFYGLESLISRFLVLNTTDGVDEPVFTLTAPPREHVALIVKSINSGFGSNDWKVGRVEGNENIVIDYVGKYCNQGLKAVADAVGTEYWIEGTTVNVCRCEHGEYVVLGYQNGLTKVQPDVADNAKVYTRLFPVGESKNIDPTKYGHSRLQLPGGARYVDINTDKYGVIHHYEQNAFAGIYPRRIGKVSSVRSEVKTGEDGNPFTIYYFRDDELSFDPNDYEIGGLVKRVSFQEGSELAGLGSEDNGTYYFEANYNSDTREFEIITVWPYDDGMQLPGGSLVPKPGDKYILHNLRMPDEYYALAEAELLEAVHEYNRQHCADVSCFKVSTDYVEMERRGLELHAGQRVRLESPEYFPGLSYKDSRITKITRKLNRPSQMDLEISDVLQKGALECINNSIDDARSYAKSMAKTMMLPDIIRTGDATPPTDNNLYSARRSQNDFMSRRKDDRSAGVIASDKALEVGRFKSGVSGGRIGMDAETGRSYGELDNLVIRAKAYFESLEIIKAATLGGKQYITPGGSVKCTSVAVKGMVEVEEERPVTDSDGNPVFNDDGTPRMETCTRLVDNGVPGDVYRCYFLAEQDGDKTETMIIPGDMAISEMFNAKTGVSNHVSNHRYWRKVTAVSNNAVSDDVGNTYGYIDLSKTDCEKDSDIPMADDVLCQLGNDNDPDRQSAMVLSTVDSDAPSIKLYNGIKDYTLTDRDVVAFGYDKDKGRAYMRCYGDGYMGSRSGRTYVWYNEALDELEVKAKISMLSTIGDKNIDDYIKDQVANAPTVMTEYSASGLEGSWHPDYRSTDLYLRISKDGGKTWDGPMRMVGADGSSYTPNLLLNTEDKRMRLISANGDFLEVYTDMTVDMTEGETYTVSGCTNAKFSASHNIQDQDACVLWLTGLDATGDRVWRKISDAEMSSDGSAGHVFTWDHPSGTYCLGVNFYTLGTWYVEKIKIDRGVNRNPSWTPAPSEMVGKDGKYTVYQWTYGTETKPTGGWVDTPLSPMSGYYVWMRTGVVTPPSTVTVWSNSYVRLTGDKGSDGREVYLLDLSNEVAGVACDSGGVVTGAYPTSQAEVWMGSEKLTGGVTYRIAGTNGVSASVSASGLVTTSNLTADTALVTIEATVDGADVTLRSSMTLYKVRPGADGSAIKTVDRTGYTTAYSLAYLEALAQKDTDGWSCVNSAGFKVGDRAVINLTLTDKDNTPCQFYGTVDAVGAWSLTLRDMSLLYGQQGADGQAAVVYSILPSVDNISRGPDGTLSATMVSCAKYRTTGASPIAVSTENTLKATVFTNGDPGTEQTIAPVGTSSGNVAINQDTTAIIFTLYQGTSSTVLDRERVPVYTDMQGTPIVGENMLLNSSFTVGSMSSNGNNDRIKFWALNANVLMDVEKLLNGNNTVRISVEGATSNQWQGATQNMALNQALAVNPGDWLTYSIWTYCDDLGALDGVGNNQAVLACQVEDVNGKNYTLKEVGITPTKNGEWQRFSATVQVPSYATSARFNFWLLRNGTMWYGQPKLERGRYPTEWTASPDDFDYLKVALKNSGSFEGGLILGSLIKLGYQDSSGYRIMAGVNGIYSPEVGSGGGLAFWAGGDQKDALLPRYKDAPDRAAYAIRHNGTGYAARGTVRFEENQVLIGEDMELNDDGLVLLKDSKELLRISNSTVGAESEFMQHSTTSITGSFTPKINLNVDGGGIAQLPTAASQSDGIETYAGTPTFGDGFIRIPSCTVIGGETYEKSVGTLPDGSTINIDVAVSFRFALSDLMMFNGGINVYIYKNGTVFYSQYVNFNQTSTNTFVAKASVRKSVSEGVYTIRVAPSSGTGAVTTTLTASGSLSGSADIGTETGTRLGNDGFLTVWGESGLMVNSKAVIMRFKKCGLRLSDDGIQRMTDGINWVAL